MSISSGIGLISGIDTQSIISQLMAINRKPITLIERRQATLNTQSSAYGVISQKLQALNDQIKNLLEPDDFLFRSATSANTAAVDVSAAKTADPGTYGVQVLQLASAQRVASQGVRDLDSSIGTGSGALVIQTGAGSVISIDVSESTTLTELRDAINSKGASGMRASIINDGSPTNPYRLVLSTTETGQANSFQVLTNDTVLDFSNKIIEEAAAATGNQFNGTVTSSGAYTGTGTMNLVAKIVEGGDLGVAKFVVSRDGGITFGLEQYTTSASPQDISGGLGVEIAFGGGSSGFAVGDSFTIDAFDPLLSQARDAVISVDGIQVRRGSNTFDDVVSGVTFTAKEVTSSAVAVTVKNEIGLLNAEIMKFQTAYNDLVSTLSALSAYDQDTKTAQPLFADSTVRNIRQSLALIVTSAVPGVTGDYQTLASLGMGLQPDGTLRFDSAKMNAALENDFTSVMKIFGRIGDSSNSQVQLLNAGTARSGAYTINVTAPALQARIDGSQMLASDGLAADETLSFTVGESTFIATLNAGDRMDQVVSKLNSAFSSQNAGLVAVNVDGALRIQSNAYGSSARFSVSSDQSEAASNQLGIGTMTQDRQGTDVSGTINGILAIGNGQNLEGPVGSAIEGLKLHISVGAPTITSLTLSRGVADQMLGAIESYIDGENGAIKVRQDGLAKTISDLNERITQMEARIDREADRLRAQFLAMEKQIAQWQNIGNYLTQSLNQLQNFRNDR